MKQTRNMCIARRIVRMESNFYKSIDLNIVGLARIGSPACLASQTSYTYLKIKQTYISDQRLPILYL